jgi:hypothetical protein
MNFELATGPFKIPSVFEQCTCVNVGDLHYGWYKRETHIFLPVVWSILEKKNSTVSLMSADMQCKEAKS